jgi:hypothetical protein
MKARAGRWERSPIIKVVRSRERLQIWLCDDAGRQLTGSIGIELASDAKRLGQDLVDQLVEKALREADRRSVTA